MVGFLNKMKSKYHTLRNMTPLKKRYFKVVSVQKNSSNVGARLVKPISGRTPDSAAKKAMTKLCKKSNIPCDKVKQTLTVTLREQKRVSTSDGGHRYKDKVVLNDNKPKVVQYKYDVQRKKMTKKDGVVNHNNKNVYYKYQIKIKKSLGRKLVNK